MYEQLICNNITLKISIWNVYTIFEKYFFLFVNKIIFFNLINLWIEPIVFFLVNLTINKTSLIRNENSTPLWPNVVILSFSTLPCSDVIHEEAIDGLLYIKSVRVGRQQSLKFPYWNLFNITLKMLHNFKKTTAATLVLNNVKSSQRKKMKKSDALQSFSQFTSRSKWLHTVQWVELYSIGFSFLWLLFDKLFSLQTVEWSRTHDTINDSSKIILCKNTTQSTNCREWLKNRTVLWIHAVSKCCGKMYGRF